MDPLGGHGPLMRALFGKDVCKNERIGLRRGCVCPARPLDLPMICLVFFFTQLELIYYLQSWSMLKYMVFSLFWSIILQKQKVSLASDPPSGMHMFPNKIQLYATHEIHSFQLLSTFSCRPYIWQNHRS